VAFAGGAGLAPEGLPGWNSTPARTANTSVGVSGYTRSLDSREWALSVAGEWGSPSYRGAFLYSYYALDSLFRQSAATLEGSFARGAFVAGLGLGFIAEWVPEGASWVYFRFKAGVSARLSGFVLSARWAALADCLREKPQIGVLWESSSSFSAYVETGFESVTVGSRLLFAWGSIETAYVFPDFSLRFGVSVGLGGIRVGVEHGTAGDVPAWNGAWLAKTFKK